MSELLGPSKEAVIASLERNPRSPWRSLKDVAAETGINAWDPYATAMKLGLTGDVQLICTPTEEGDFVTTRRHYNKTAGFWRRLLSASIGKYV